MSSESWKPRGGFFVEAIMIIQTHNPGHRIYTGVSGEHYVAAEISRLGAIATITSKNTPAYDIIASNNDGTRTVIIQVKTGRGDTGAFIVGGRTMPKYPDNAFFVFVLLKNDAQPEYWIVPAHIVAEYAERDYVASLKNLKAPEEKAVRRFSWKYLRSEEFENLYQNDFNRLAVFDA